VQTMQGILVVHVVWVFQGGVRGEVWVVGVERAAAMRRVFALLMAMAAGRRHGVVVMAVFVHVRGRRNVWDHVVCVGEGSRHWETSEWASSREGGGSEHCPIS
jgi:hypothetical protein